MLGIACVLPIPETQYKLNGSKAALTKKIRFLSMHSRLRRQNITYNISTILTFIIKEHTQLFLCRTIYKSSSMISAEVRSLINVAETDASSKI